MTRKILSLSIKIILILLVIISIIWIFHLTEKDHKTKDIQKILITESPVVNIDNWSFEFQYPELIEEENLFTSIIYEARCNDENFEITYNWAISQLEGFGSLIKVDSVYLVINDQNTNQKEGGTTCYFIIKKPK